MLIYMGTVNVKMAYWQRMGFLNGNCITLDMQNRIKVVLASMSV